MSIADFSGRSRLDACPGALQVHAAADGGLARVRVPGGRLTPFQLRELAEAASTYGGGVIELTSRANVQVRGLGPFDPSSPDSDTESGAGNVAGNVAGSGFAARMARAGLLPSATHERIRNILASPLTGLDGPDGLDGLDGLDGPARLSTPSGPGGASGPNAASGPGGTEAPDSGDAPNRPDRPSRSGHPEGGGIVDITPLIGELDRRLCARPALAALPGRFMFALDDGRGDVAGLGADAGILPTGPDEAALLLAGTDTGLRVPLNEAVTALLAAAEGFLDELATRDVTAWRIAELPGGSSLVAARVRTALGIPGTTPFDPVRPRVVSLGPVGVIGSTDGTGDGTGSATGTGGETAPGSGTGRGVGDDVEGGTEEELEAGAGDGTGDRGARVALGVAIPLGRLTSAMALLLADAASGGEIRLTPWRGVVLPGLDRAEVAGTAARLEAAGLVVDPASPWIGVTACTGRPGCAKSLADVQADAATAITIGTAPPSATPPSTTSPVGSEPSGSEPSGDEPLESGPSGSGPYRSEQAGSGPSVAPPSGKGPGTDTLPVHWAGCGRRCGRPRGRVADVVATGDGYRLELDGTGLTCSGIEETAAALVAARGEM
ncbi:precorrin-3B synthase [Streptosporangium vulgare]|uniref:Precorrin-3B synthase n=1 Tax=Streptosporangium vulgare TaxID=46190 RepID=A0ABV5TKS4_9ACTN